jgi:hypothetical protein
MQTICHVLNLKLRLHIGLCPVKSTFTSSVWYDLILLIVVFWVVTSRSLIGGYQHFGGTYRLLLNPDDGSDKFFRNVGNHLQDYTVSQPR